METITLNDLEIEHGTAILSGLCGQALIRNQQPVRLKDQTKHSAEFYFKADRQGKPYIQDFQNSKRYYPVTAYAEFYGLDFQTAKAALMREYYGESKSEWIEKRVPKQRLSITPSPIDYLPVEQYQRCQTLLERNGLYEYLRFTYGPEKANEAFRQYRIGTSRHWQYLGYLTTCLPQFDIAGNLRQVKLIVFDAMNGRRVKNHQTAQKWNPQLRQYEPTEPDSDKSKVYGKYLFGKAYQTANLQQCFFGEHLLREYPGQSVALVEGESTAIVCSILWPEFIWLATGGSNGARWTDTDIFNVLSGSDVTLWPDTDAHEKWNLKAEALRPLVRSLQVTSYVKDNTPEGMSKLDLRDLITRPRWISNGQTIYGEVLTIVPSENYPAEWDHKVN